MYKAFAFMAAAVLVVALVGCDTGNTDSGSSATWSNPLASRNLQFASLNSTGQVATALLLDNTSEENLDNTINTLKGCLADAENALNGEVTFENLGPLLTAKIPEGRYRAYVTQILVLVEGRTVPTDKIGEYNIRRIQEFLDGARYRADHYDAGARTKDLKMKKNDTEINLGIVAGFYMSDKAPVKKDKEVKPAKPACDCKK